jgi:hypothetical protein
VIFCMYRLDAYVDFLNPRLDLVELSFCSILVEYSWFSGGILSQFFARCSHMRK